MMTWGRMTALFDDPDGIFMIVLSSRGQGYLVSYVDEYDCY